MQRSAANPPPGRRNKKPCLGGPEPSELHSQCPAPPANLRFGEEIPRSAGQEAGFQRASPTGAVGSEALSRKVSLHVSPAAPKKEGKWALAEKIAGGALFGQTEKPPLLPLK